MTEQRSQSLEKRETLHCKLELTEETVTFHPRLVFRRRFPRRCGSAFRQQHVGTNSTSSSASQGLLLALVALALLSPRSFGQESSKKAEVSPMEAVLRLHLPYRNGVASACCIERAIEIQKSVQGMIAFYREKLGVGDPIGVAVLDENDWDRMREQMRDHRFQPYGLTNYQPPGPVAPSGYVIFIPADDKGVITQNLQGERQYATPATLKLFASAHLTYDEAVRRAILHTAHHETGHTLVYQYGIGQSNHFLGEILATYFAYTYEKARDHQTATVFDGIVKMRVPPGAYRSLEDFEAHYTNMQPVNYGWYQMQFALRVLEIYNEQGLGFLPKVRSAFPKGTPEMGVADTLTRLEAISPGFQAWARSLSQYKSGVVPAH
jgi:hypothetical protein